MNIIKSSGVHVETVDSEDENTNTIVQGIYDNINSLDHSLNIVVYFQIGSQLYSRKKRK